MYLELSWRSVKTKQINAFSEEQKGKVQKELLVKMLLLDTTITTDIQFLHSCFLLYIYFVMFTILLTYIYSCDTIIIHSTELLVTYI